ncbi:unnamed protein product [Heterobilharzia americana]|nr:unnamed protein product [Heterobilharzia americana]
MSAGRWLRGCEILLKKRHGLLIDNSKGSTKHKTPLRYTSALRDLKLSSCQQQGFTVLQILLPYHLDLIETYLFLFALLLKIPVRCMPKNAKFDFDTFYSFIAYENNCISPTLMRREIDSTGTTMADRSTHCTSFISSLPSTTFGTSTSVSSLMSGFFSGSGGSRRIAPSTTSPVVTAPNASGNTNSSNKLSSNAPMISHLQASTFSGATNNNFTPSLTNAYSNQVICPEAGTLILQLIRILVYRPESLQHAKLTEFVGLLVMKSFNVQENIESAVVMLKFLIYLYQSKPAIRLVFTTSSLLTNLIGLLIPFTQITTDVTAHHNPLRRLSSSHENFKDQMLLSLLLPSSSSNYCSRNPFYQITLDFIKLIVSDSFALHPSYHQPTHIVDILLEAWSDQCSSKQHQNLQTLILCNLMDHFLATDIINDGSLCVGPNGNIQYIPANLIYFSARIVDKLWQGCFSKEVNRVVNFLIHLITHWPDQSTTSTFTTATTNNLSSSKLDNLVNSNTSTTTTTVNNNNNNNSSNNLLASKFTIHSLYRSLNRTILYQLSRPILTKMDQIQTLNLLNRLNNTLITCSSNNNRRSIDGLNTNVGGCLEIDQLLLRHTQHHHHHDQIPMIFDPINEDPEFPACLVHLLIQLIR